MFKAIGRWGAHVRSTLNIPFLSSIFGSKAKKYGDLDNDEEEIFVDAEEDIHHEDEHLDGKLTLRPNVSTDSASTKEIRVTKSQDSIQDTGANEVVKDNCDTKDKSGITTEVEISICSNGREIDQCVTDSSSLAVPNETHQAANDQNESGSSSENDDDTGNNEDDHHVNHKDTKKMVKNSKSSNGIVQSASAAVLKVHRRVNSYTQRQYAKFDNAQDDENDNIVQHEHVGEVSYEYGDDIETVQTQKSEKKTKRRKKVAFFELFRGIFKFRSRQSSTRM